MNTSAVIECMMSVVLQGTALSRAELELVGRLWPSPSAPHSTVSCVGADAPRPPQLDVARHRGVDTSWAGAGACVA